MVLRRREAFLLTALGLGLALVTPGVPQAVEAPMELQWHQLVPPSPPKPPKSFQIGRAHV